jgi:catechol 2,3-dioxygenase-like lactoylglutathione lyase family enzyme
MARISIRYIVADVPAAVTFYADMLGFKVEMQPGPGFAMLSHDGVRLLLNQPGGGGGAGQAVSGQMPEPGGWNRMQVEVENLAETAKRLKHAGCHFRGEIILGRGGKQLLVEDPSGNPVELFEPTTQG